MTRKLTIAMISAVFASSLAFYASAQDAETQADPQTSFQDLLDQIQEDKETSQRDPHPAVPTAPAPNSPIIFPEDDGDPRELPWDGLQASTAFAKIENGVQHTLSKLRCADTIAGYKLNHIRQITGVGEAVVCRFEHDLGSPERSSLANPNAQILMFRPPPDRTVAAQMADFQSDTEERMTDARLLSTEAQMVRFVDRDLSCPSVTYALGSGANAQHLTTTICEVGGWRIRVRHIAQQNSGAPSVADFINQFANLQAPAMDHVDKCDAFFEKVRNETPSGLTGISYNAVAFPYVERGDSCYAGSSASAEGGVIVRYWPDNPDTPITVDLLSPNGQYQETPSFRVQNMWANVPADEAGPAGYLLMREQADGTIATYIGYTRIPSDARAYQDATRAYRGETEATFLAKQNEGGGWTMMAQ